MLCIDQPDPRGVGALNTLNAEPGDRFVLIDVRRSADAQSYYASSVRGYTVQRVLKRQVVCRIGSTAEELRLPRDSKAAPHAVLTLEQAGFAIDGIRRRNALHAARKVLGLALEKGEQALAPDEVIEPLLAWAKSAGLLAESQSE